MNDTIWLVCLGSISSAVFWAIGYIQGMKRGPLHRTIELAAYPDGNLIAITSDAFTEAEMERIRLTLKAARENGELPTINSETP